MDDVYCGHCGNEAAGSDDLRHRTCREALMLEPPRYCSQCRRRMKVQVTPTGWNAQCSVHAGTGWFGTS